jgi:protein-S-isoprenylcysteine O-methyltransferase Ste14
VFWLSGIVLQFLDRYYTVLDLLTCSFLMTPFVQIVGLVVLYAGSLFLAWTIGSAGKSLRPSTSGVHADHRLVQDGPLGIVRHPYYVSYVVVLVGLGLTLATLWPLLLALCVAIGMVPTAEAEEKQLAALFGEEYKEYQQRVGRFSPKVFR